MAESDLSVLEGAVGSAADLPAATPNSELDADVTDELPAEAGQPYVGIRTPYRRAQQEKQIPVAADDAAIAALKEGTTFIAPDGSKRIKPYSINSEVDIDRVPEGAQVLTPDGRLRKKPKFEPVSFTTQTLYDMALTDKERRKILEKEYGRDRVQQDSRGLFAIDEGGTYRKPGYGMTALAGGVTAAAAPVTASVLGAIGGGVAGVAGGPPGVFVGGTAGGAGGGILGQYLNDVVLQLAGVYDRTKSEEAGNLAVAGLTSAMGAGVGRGIAAVAPTIKQGISHATTAAPTALRKLLGASGEDLAMAAQIADKGTSVPPSAVFKGAPHLQNVVERFDPAMDTSAPLKRSVERHYERGAGEILEDLGVPSAGRGSMLEPGAAPGTQRAGESLIARAMQESSDADAALTAAISARRAIAEVGAEGRVAQREVLTETAERARGAAQQLVNAGYDDIAKAADDAMRVAQAGHNSGDLWEAVGAKLTAVRQGIGARAKKMYDEADMLAGHHRPDVRDLPVTARTFLEQLPEDFQKKYPDIVQKLERLGGVFDKETGEMLRPPSQPMFGELRNLRTLLRGNADWHTLSSDVKNGTYKFFSKQVDDALHNVEATPALKDAVGQLDIADKFWRENIPIFESRQIRAIMKGLEAGEPADPKVLYQAVIKEGHTDLIERIRGMVGPNLWKGVQGADLRTMLDNSKDLLPGVIDGRRFVNEVLDRHRSGLLQAVHGDEIAARILKQAEDVRVLTDARVPIQVRPGDTTQEVIMRARAATAEATAAAKQDPLAVLQREMKQVEREERRAAAGSRSRKDDPLGFLYDPTTGAAEATKRILGNEDLILATARRFGADSPEFEMLRQVYAQQILQGAMQPSAKLAKISDEVQQLMFPGVTRKQMETLAKEMDFLTDTKIFASGDFGGALSATAKVEHPIAGRIVSGILKMAPGVNMAARSALGAYYAFARRMSAENPVLFNYLLKGLNGSEEEKQAVRAILSRHAQMYGGMGAGTGEMLYQRGQGDQRGRSQ